MRIKIVSPGGDVFNTRFFDAETDQEIVGSVVDAQWHGGVDGARTIRKRTTVTLTLLAGPAELGPLDAEITYVPAAKVALIHELHQILQQNLADFCSAFVANLPDIENSADLDEFHLSLSADAIHAVLEQFQKVLYQDAPDWPNLHSAFAALSPLERAYYLKEIKQLLALSPEERERFNLKLAKE